MKRVLSLLAALLVCAMCVLPAAAQPAVCAADAALTTAGSQSAGADATGEVIDLDLASTLIVVICSVLTLIIVITVIFLARKNRS